LYFSGAAEESRQRENEDESSLRTDGKKEGRMSIPKAVISSGDFPGEKWRWEEQIHIPADQANVHHGGGGAKVVSHLCGNNPGGRKQKSHGGKIPKVQRGASWMTL
jgi:hypothetical protein